MRNKATPSQASACVRIDQSRVALLALYQQYERKGNLEGDKVFLQQQHMEQLYTGITGIGGFHQLGRSTKGDLLQLKPFLKVIIEHHKLKEKHTKYDYEGLLDPIFDRNRAQTLSSLQGNLADLKSMQKLDPLGNNRDGTFIQDGPTAYRLIKELFANLQLQSLGGYHGVTPESQRSLQNIRWYTKALIMRHSLQVLLGNPDPSKIIPDECDHMRLKAAGAQQPGRYSNAGNQQASSPTRR